MQRECVLALDAQIRYKRSKAAERWCAALASKAPKSDAVLFKLGSLRYQLGEYAGSVDAFRTCLQLRPEWPAAQFNLGLALRL